MVYVGVWLYCQSLVEIDFLSAIVTHISIGRVFKGLLDTHDNNRTTANATDSCDVYQLQLVREYSSCKFFNRVMEDKFNYQARTLGINFF